MAVCERRSLRPDRLSGRGVFVEEQPGHVRLRFQPELPHRARAAAAHEGNRQAERVGDEFQRLAHRREGKYLALAERQGARVADLGVVAARDEKAPAVGVEVAVDVDGSAVALGAPMPDLRRPSKKEAAMWGLVTAHLAARSKTAPDIARKGLGRSAGEC
jgi:hypothetical protein